MTQNTTYRSMGLIVLVILAAAVGAVAVIGTVTAQDAGDNTSGNTSTANATDESFYTPSAEDPLNVRFRDCCGHTVHSVDEGVLNLNIVNGMYNGDPYDVKITASGLGESQIENIVFDSSNYDTENLGRTAIVGTNFTGVPSGEYEFTVSVVGTDATETVMLEVTDGQSAMTDESGIDNATAGNETGMDNATTGNETGMDNATTGNETGMDNATTDDAMAGNETQMENTTQMGNMTGNISISAAPNTTGTVANYTISVPVSAASAGNLSAIAINFTGTNASLFGVNPSSIYIVNITQPNGSVVTAAGNVTAVSSGFTGLKAILQFGGNKTISADDRIRIRFGGVTNPAKPGMYTIDIDVNPERGNDTRTASLTITQNASAGGTNATTTPTTTATEMGAATTSGTAMAPATTSGTAMAPDTDVSTVSAQTATGGDGGTGGNGSDGGQQGTPAGGPGFGIVVAVVALLGAALLAVRHN